MINSNVKNLDGFSYSEIFQWKKSEGGNGNFYAIAITDSKNLEEYQASAINAGGHLLTINSLQEQSWLSSLAGKLGSTPAILGISYIDGEMIWNTGSEKGVLVDYKNFWEGDSQVGPIYIAAADWNNFQWQSFESVWVNNVYNVNLIEFENGSNFSKKYFSFSENEKTYDFLQSNLFEIKLPVVTSLAGENISYHLSLEDGKPLPTFLRETPSLDGVKDKLSLMGYAANSDVGTYKIKWTAESDAGYFDQQIITIKINDINDPPYVNTIRLDKSFSNDGISTIDIYNSNGLDIALNNFFSKSGNLYVVGRTHTYGDMGGSNYSVIKYNSSGNLDSNFGVGGVIAPLQSGSQIQSYFSQLLEVENSIYAVGSSNGRNGYSDILISRLADNKIDDNFSNHGFYSFNSGYEDDEVIKAQQDGSNLIILTNHGILKFNYENFSSEFIAIDAGSSRYQNRPEQIFQRIYGGEVNVENGNIFVAGMSGNLIPQVAGSGITYWHYETTDIRLVKYCSDGTKDLTFSNDGIFDYSFGQSTNEWAIDVKEDTEGNIFILGGVNGGGVGNDIFIIKLKSDGNLDSSFADSGKFILSRPLGDDEADSFMLDPLGRILIGGATQVGDHRELLLARLDTNGNLDSKFGVGGVFTQKIDSNFADPKLAAITFIDGDPDNLRLAASGYSWNSLTQGDFATAVFRVRDPLINQSAIESELFKFEIPVDAFVDDDSQDKLSYKATLSNGNPLPDWLKFDNIKHIFSGTPNSGDVKKLDIKVSVTDKLGFSAADTFSLNIIAQPINVIMSKNESDQVLNGSLVRPNAIFGKEISESIIGGNLNDKLYGYGGADSISGGLGADTLYGGDGNDTVIAGDGGDLIIGGDGAGNDNYDGGSGRDTVKYTSALDGITINLTTGTATSNLGGDAAGIGIDALNSIENVIAGYHNDLITGSADKNTILGESGNDTIFGGEGRDYLSGGEGNDYLDGGAGIDLLMGGTGDDIYVVDSFRDVIIDHSGRDTIKTQNLNEINLQRYRGIESAEYFGAGDVTLIGNHSSNSLIGGAGSDTLTGKFGNDTLSGAGGSDKFVFNAKLDAQFNFDQITDFSTGSNKLVLDKTIFTRLTSAVQSSHLVVGTEAQDSDDYLIYDSNTQTLYYDADGNAVGAKVAFAQLIGVNSLSSSDFSLI